MKKISDDKFQIKWKPLHKKGVHAYMVRNMLGSLVTIFIILLLSKGTLIRTILAFVFGGLTFAMLHIVIWSINEKKYNKIEKINALH